jgi:hypothetical protein
MTSPHTLEKASDGRYVLGGRVLSKGDELEVRLGGNAGWQPVTVESSTGGLRVTFTAADGRRVVTTMPIDTPVRWPD